METLGLQIILESIRTMVSNEDEFNLMKRTREVRCWDYAWSDPAGSVRHLDMVDDGIRKREFIGQKIGGSGISSETNSSMLEPPQGHKTSIPSEPTPSGLTTLWRLTLFSRQTWHCRKLRTLGSHCKRSWSCCMR
ncbi:hypothetical protein V6N13_110864 [Hibiscus sabdariffa]|uniref:Uncharacterized protein n=1 Tax=Hibiscus sabdariffa TaxID=183260 RepID=A0ABR2TIH7_9ROSI